MAESRTRFFRGKTRRFGTWLSTASYTYEHSMTSGTGQPTFRLLSTKRNLTKWETSESTDQLHTNQASDGIFALQYPDAVQACPDIFRSRLFITSEDAASPDSLLRVIKQFQGWYAEFSDLAPWHRTTWPEAVIRIQTVPHTKQFAEGIRLFRTDTAELKALVAEIIVGIRRQRDRWHRSELSVRPAAGSVARDGQ